MSKGQQPGAAGPSCTYSTDAVDKLAQSVGVGGTPMLIAADGRKSAGAMPAAQLMAWLGDGAAAQTVKVSTNPTAATAKTLASATQPR